jgi:dihydrofolate reductase
MAKLLYVMNASLDGSIADEDGKLDWTAPDEEYRSFINDLERPVGTYLYGRRLYELMAVWETSPAATPQSPAAREFAQIWRSADKVVYSKTLAATASTRTRIERDFDPDAVRQLKAAAEHDLTVGGPALGAQAITAGLVDEYHCWSCPSCWAGASTSSPTGPGSSWSCWTSAGSATARCTCATAPRHEQTAAAPKPDSDPHGPPQKTHRTVERVKARLMLDRTAPVDTYRH